MKRILAVALLAIPLSFACATAAHAMGKDKDKDKGRGGKPPKRDRDRGGQTVAAPEIDGAAGTLAIALAGGGLALLSRSRRRLA